MAEKPTATLQILNVPACDPDKGAMMCSKIAKVARGNRTQDMLVAMAFVMADLIHNMLKDEQDIPFDKAAKMVADDIRTIVAAGAIARNKEGENPLDEPDHG